VLEKDFRKEKCVIIEVVQHVLEVCRRVFFLSFSNHNNFLSFISSEAPSSQVS